MDDAMYSGLAASVAGRMLTWSLQHQKTLLRLCVSSLTVLFFAFLLTLTIKVLPSYTQTYLHAAALASAGLVVLCVAPKGLVPVVICMLGVFLIHNAITLPLNPTTETINNPTAIGGQNLEWTLYSEQAVQVRSAMHYFLGMSMVILGMIVAYRPSLLFTRNRPQSADEEWSRYPIWQGKPILAVGEAELAIPLRDMLTEQDRRLLWRYEYVLVSINGTAHLVEPGATVPASSTALLRDREGGRLLGKARYAGFFI